MDPTDPQVSPRQHLQRAWATLADAIRKAARELRAGIASATVELKSARRSARARLRHQT